MIIHSDFMTYDEFLKVEAFDGKSSYCGESNSVKRKILPAKNEIS